MMYSILVSLALAGLLYFALHVSGNGSFPKPLSPEEERDCLRRTRQGDCSARNKLVEHNLRLVAHIVKKYYSSNKEQDDLISIGTIGLIKAVSSFQEEKGTKFATYAARCIENEILMYFRNLKKTAQDISISEPIDTDSEGNSLTLQDIIFKDDTIADDLELKIRAEKLHRLMDTVLTEREKVIVALRYGITGQKPLAQREVAEKLDISRSYVSRIEKKALEKLKRHFETTESSKK